MCRRDCRINNIRKYYYIIICKKIIGYEQRAYYTPIKERILVERNDKGDNIYEKLYSGLCKKQYGGSKTYCKAFGAEITLEMKDSNGTAYEYCELSVNGQGFLAISEAKNPCDVDFIHKMKWETMTFNVFEMGIEESVQRAFDVFRDGGIVIEAIHELPWSKCCATVINKYSVAQPDSYDIYKIPAAKFLRIRMSDETARVLGHEPWGAAFLHINGLGSK